jgi:hypothetical protein
MMELRTEWEREVHAAISPRVRAQPRQTPELSAVQTPMQGVAMVRWEAGEGGVIFLKV